MGAYLSSPITTKESVAGENDLFSWGVSAMQGWRTDMEDAHAVVLDVDQERTGFFGVFDGHGGKEVAKFAAKHLADELSRSPGFQSGDLDQAFVHAFLRMDQLLLRQEHAPELAAMRGEGEAGAVVGSGGGGGGGGGGPMVINGSHLPDGLLEALGMPKGGGKGFQIKLIRSGPGGRNISIDDIEEEGEEPSGKPVFELNIGGEDDGGKVDLSAFDELKGEEGEAEDEESEQTSRGEDPDFEDDLTADAAENDGGDRAGGKRKRAMDVDSANSEKPEGSRSTDPSTGPEDEDQGKGEDEDEYQGPSAGCTAVCAVVRGNMLVVANAGDSRCVLSRRGMAVALTQDHKPNDEEEYARILKAGGFVADGRVNGSLNLSRALGDMEYKQNKELGPEGQMVTAMPEVRRMTLKQGDEFLLLACDGIWDVCTNQEAIDFVRERLLVGKAPKQVCEELCDHCLAPDTGGCGKGCDNMSVVITTLKAFADTLPKPQGAGAGPSKA